MIETSKNKILREVVILLHLLVRKIKKHKFGQFFAKKCDEKVKQLYLLHTMSKKMYNISKCSARKSTSDFDGLRPVCKFLESSNSKKKKSYAQISVFLNFC